MKYKPSLLTLTLFSLALALVPIIYAGLGQESHGYAYDTIGTAKDAGLIINVTSNFTLINVTKWSPSTADRVTVYSLNSSGGNGTILQRGYFTGDSANLSVNLVKGTGYIISADRVDGADHTTAYVVIPASSFPIAGRVLNWTNSSWLGVPSGNGPNIWNIYSLTYTDNNLGPNETYYNLSTYQTTTENILANFTLDVTPSSATLYYNNQSYGTTITNTQNNVYRFSNSLDIPTNSINTGIFYWNITYSNGTIARTNNFYQQITPINLSYCAGANNVSFFNVTFKNETSALERVNATITSSTFYYWLTTGTGVSNKTLSYSNLVENKEYDFCFSPASKNVKSTLSLSYSNAESQQRTYEPSTLTLTNTTTHTTLFLLPTISGQYVTFQVINTAQQSLSGVNIVVSRSGIGTIETAITDSSGSVSLFLNPNFVYSFTFSKSGFSDYTTSITPSQTSYTITLGSSSSSTNVTNPSAGMSFSIKPIAGTLNNNTLYNFNLTLNSSYWVLDSWGYTLQNKSGFVLASNSSTASSGGFLSNNLNTGANKTIVMNYFWVINGVYNNATVSWGVINLADNGFSIYQFFLDLKSYVSLGFFGLDDVGLAMLTFFSIFLITGVLSYKFGINSPAAIIGLIFGLVLFFDVGLAELNLIPNPAGALPHAPTFIIAIILVALIFREMGR